MLPTTFWLVTTYSCNDRCGVCYAAADCCVPLMQRDNGHNVMPLEYAREVMQEMKDCGAENCLLIGGEPTLYPHLLEIIRFGRALGLQMKLVSNGRRLSDMDFVKKLKAAGLVHASVSIEASDASLHNKITQSDGYEERLAGLRNLIAAGVSHNSILTLSVENADEIVPVARQMRDMGVENILFNFALPSIRDGRVDGDLSLNPRECAERMTVAYRQLKDDGIHICIFATLPLCLFDEDIRQEMIGDKTIARNYHCHIFFGTGVAFEPNGNVLPCTHFAGTPLFNAMSPDEHFTYRGRFAHEWENGIHKSFIKEAWRYPAERCKSCSLWGTCVGGCPIQWLHFNPAEFIGHEGR